jgi:hypothetical protein
MIRRWIWKILIYQWGKSSKAKILTNDVVYDRPDSSFPIAFPFYIVFSDGGNSGDAAAP